MNTSLNRARRAAELAALDEVDVLVVGLGATGAGAALDAASRGLRVAAVDTHDLAFGTSRWSSKMIHGGLRYLAQGQLGVAYESAVERGTLLTTTAPHLVRPQPFVLPLTPDVSAGKAAVTRIGLGLGDGLRLLAGTPGRVLPPPRRISVAETLRLAPGLRAEGLRGGLRHWDGHVVDDARLVVALARTAAGRGASILTRCRALSLGPVSVLRDELTGDTFEVRARAVINAAGVWAGQLDPTLRLRPSRGAHLVLPSALLGDPTAALNIPVPGERSRYVLVLPQGDGRTYVGLTDVPVDGDPPDVPVPSAEEVAFLLDAVRAVFATPIGETDVIGAFAGLRPLLAADGRTADLSRRHAVRVSPSGAVTIVGGKLTTYRRMAADAVDRAVGLAGLRCGPCVTRRLPLVGAGNPDDGYDVGAGAADPSVPARLVARYGTEAALLARGDLTPVAPGSDVTRAELDWGVRHEGALDEGDLLDRRTRIGLVDGDRAAALPAARAALAA
ncbi:glycerol-3-phosphate dehydrogenase [Longispora fulva]|uniref:Glycerol-3-phosphate dehydrogenase n=1 Tax=Longispora fulva TaxID=619741 RepID=A0A8J7KKM2_9ACTN|nr:glycerol-3-phosphate dehydrogenase/oxidase [Longispora fulva]MBG6141405.1 glycerol-3-phosphate dehydrogenase [Longispora fulva]GIG59445.1 glycerol-3-phosphate dehydrogenase [Longispora fulva]